MFKLPGRAKAALIWGGVLAGLYIFFRFLLPFVLPFLIGLCLARWMEPSVKALRDRLGLPRPLGAGLITALLVGLLLAVCWLAVSRLMREAGELLEQMPAFMSRLPEISEVWEARVYGWIEAAPPSLRETLRGGFDSLMSGSVAIPASLYTTLMARLSGIAAALPSLALFICASILGTFLISCDYPRLTGLMLRPFSISQKEKILLIQARMADTLGKWLKAQGMMMGMTFVLLCIGFWVLRMDAVLLPAALIALVDALPVLGAGLCLIPWALYNWAAGDIHTAIGLVVLFGVIVLARGLAEPKLVGSQLGMRALPTFAAMYIGFKAMGVWGMILFPILAITVKQVWDSFKKDA